MNQILVTGEETYSKTKKEKVVKQPKEKKLIGINPIIIFYAISIIILGICMISGSVYASGKINETIAINTKPSVEIIRNDDNNTVDIKIKHIRGIKTVSYKWNNDEEKIIEGQNQKEISTSINLIGGNNTLTVSVTEENGQTVSYTKQYSVGNIPKITLEAVSNGIKIKTTSEKEIKELRYSWDEEEKKKVEVGQKEYETTIETPKGQHELKIEVEDVEGNIGTKTQKVVGDTAPTLTIKPQMSNGKLVFAIDAEDDENIESVEITFNEGTPEVISVNEKTFHKEVEIEAGTNKIKVVVYNKNKLQTTKGGLYKNY